MAVNPYSQRTKGSEGQLRLSGRNRCQPYYVRLHIPSLGFRTSLRKQHYPGPRRCAQAIGVQTPIRTERGGEGALPVSGEKRAERESMKYYFNECTPRAMYRLRVVGRIEIALLTEKCLQLSINGRWRQRGMVSERFQANNLSFLYPRAAKLDIVAGEVMGT